jgi:threonine dehydratase
MTAHMEKSSYTIVNGDEALEIIDKYRRNPLLEMPQHVPIRVEAIEAEFPWFSQLGNRALYLARAEDNAVGTFKLRGALVAVEVARRDGSDRVIAASAKNHGLGVAMAVLIQKHMHGLVVVPRNTPQVALDSLNEIANQSDGRVVIDNKIGDTYDECREATEAMGEAGEGRVIPAFNDPNVTAGQGTIVSHIKQVIGPVEHYALPTGGGGLTRGVLNRIVELGHDSHVHAFEAEGSDSMSRSVAAGEVITATSPNDKYGGSRVREIGGIVLETLLSHPDRFSTYGVWDDEVDNFIDFYAYYRHETGADKFARPLEPTTLVAAAGLFRIIQQGYIPADERVALIGTGMNAPLYPELQKKSWY